MDNAEFRSRYEAGQRDFRGVDLHGQVLNLNIVGADLRMSNLSQTKIYHCTLSNSNLSNANFQEAEISKSNFFNSNLSEANFSQAVFDNISFRDVSLNYANFATAKLLLWDAIRCDFIYVNLDNSILANVNFIEANLTKSNWATAILSSVNFIESNLTDACLDKIEFNQVELIGSIMPNRILYRGNLPFTDFNISNGNASDFDACDIGSEKFNINTQLFSEVGLDYSNLSDLLAAEQWKMADYETSRIMLQAVGREVFEFIRWEEMQKFPRTDLQTIDGLWMQYSGDRFGFSIQDWLWQSVGGKDSYDREAECRFGDRVEWRKQGSWISYSEAVFSKFAPIGHLPLAGIGCAVFGWWRRNRHWLFSRVRS